jgi:thiamine pyrophosphate-dependent acetolactate synthase large subunit-like protein
VICFEKFKDASEGHAATCFATRQLDEKAVMDGTEENQITVADYIAHCLVDCGVTHVFGGHGGAVVPLIDSICRHPKLTWVLTRIEVSASMAASAYAKVSGTLGCCVGTSGPGASHLITGLIDSESDRVPVLCLTGLKKRENLGCSDFQDISQAELFSAGGISYSHNVVHRNGLVPLLRDAIATALSNDVCAHLALPLDVQQARITPPPCLSKCFAGGDLTNHCRPAASEIENVADFLVQCRLDKELVIFAIGQRAVGKAAGHVLSIAETLGVPVVTTLDAKGCVREDHPQVLGVFGIFGQPGMEASASLIETATTIVSFGVDDHSQLLLLAKEGLQTARLVQINHVNLHDLRFQTAHSLAGDIASIAEKLLQEISFMKAKGDTKCVDIDYISPKKAELDVTERTSIKTVKVAEPDITTSTSLQTIQVGGLKRNVTWGSTKTFDRFAAEAIHQRACIYEVPSDEIKKGFCHPGLIMSRLTNVLKEGAIVSIDVGECALWASLCLCLKLDRQRAITSLRMGTRGYSIYGAMGAVAFNPDVQIVGIADDRSFQFAVNELATLRQMQATVVFIIFSGGSAGCDNGQGTGEKLNGCRIQNPDFCKVAKANGGQGIRIDQSDPKAVDESLQNAFRNTGLTIVEVVRDPAIKPLKERYSFRRPTKARDRIDSKEMLGHKHAWGNE